MLLPREISNSTPLALATVSVTKPSVVFYFSRADRQEIRIYDALRDVQSRTLTAG